LKLRELDNSGAFAIAELLSITNLNDFNGPHRATNLVHVIRIRGVETDATHLQHPAVSH
jgi:hypothetical protein